ncbi:MAG TPA: hypothetical protein VK327_13615 [Candidatus Paceibacterota bacterium]|nr:hypothetical protein [Candidatus Paceibacterota bacterium]
MKRIPISVWSCFVVISICCVGNAGVFPIATNPAVVEFGGKVALNGTNYLAGLVSGTNIVGQWLTPSAQLSGTPIDVGANPGFPPAMAMASAKTNSLAAWTDYSISAGVTAFGRLISANGLGISFPLLANAGGHGVQAIQAAASDGTNFLAVWRDNSTGTYYGQNVSGNGVLSGSEFPIFTMAGNGDRNIALAFGQTNYLIAWQDGTGGGDETYCKLISPSGSVGSVFQINTTSSSDMNPAVIGFDGTNYLVVWNRATNYSSGGWPEWQLCGRLVSQSGVALGNELVLASEQAAFPAIGFDGANYLLAWGYNTSTTNADKTIHARFFDRSANALGPIITPFPAQGTNPPLLPLDGVLFDGQRFLLTATFGSFVQAPNGDVAGFVGGDVYGTFLPRSTKQPTFTNCAVRNGHFQGQLLVVPGITYTMEISTNLQTWNPVGTISSGATNLLDIQDPAAVTDQNRRFYRATVGNVMPVTYAFAIHEFANAGSFGGGTTPTVTFPVSLSSYSANFDVSNDSGLPAATSVYFTGPAGSGLTNQPADPNNSWLDLSDAQYQSPFVSNPAAASAGTWTVNYKGANQTFNIADPQAASRLAVPLPTVTVNGDVLQSVSWVFKDAATGATLGNAPGYVTDVQVQVEGLVGGRIYESPLLVPSVLNHTLTSNIAWSNVSMLYMAYDDTLGNHYVVMYSKP